MESTQRIEPQYCDWIEYKKQIFKEKQKKNLDMAPILEATLTEQALLAEKIAKIQANPVWKALTPIQKIGERLLKNREKNRHSKEDACFLRYQEEVFRQKHPYSMWIQENERIEDENVLNNNISSNTTIARVYIEELVENYQWDSDVSYYLLVSKNGMLHETAMKRIEILLQHSPDVEMAYGDEDFYVDSLENRILPWFKPDWSPNTFLSFNYMGNCVLISKRQLSAIEYLNSENCLLNYYDLLLQISENVIPYHIPNILFHNDISDYISNSGYQVIPNKNWDNLQRTEDLLETLFGYGTWEQGCQKEYNIVKERAFQRRNLQAHLETTIEPNQYHVVYDWKVQPKVSAVVLSKDHPDTLELCMKSLRERTDYNNLEIIVVDNGSNEENKKKIELLKVKYNFDYLYEPMDFNFSKQCNIGVNHSSGDYILLLNDDVEVIQKDWLRYMVGQAMQPQVGAVGAKLLYAGTIEIQHAGITNMQIGPSHKLIYRTDDMDCYFGRNRLTYDMLGVTAACIVIDKKKYLQVGGLEESLKVAYNDVDFCFKLYEAGYYNVLRNDAVLYHYESLSRGLDSMDEDKWNRLLSERDKLYKRHPDIGENDPFYHNSLADDSTEYECNFRFDHKDRNKHARLEKADAGKLASREKENLELHVDRVQLERGTRYEESDFYLIDGWFYLAGEDNSLYGKQVLLKGVNHTYLVEPYAKYRKDVETILPQEKNISLAGFITRIDTNHLPSDTYQVGILLKNMVSEENYIAFSTKKLCV